jgi:hypothetical protein
MSADPFNSLGGFSVNIPPIQVIDANGNVVTNVLALSGNVAANAIYSDNYRYANGVPFTGGNATNPGGSNTQIQFNNNGSFGGIPNATWNGNILSLGNVSALSIGGGSNGYFLRTDGNGLLSWVAGVSNSTPGGSNTQIQFNDAGILAGNNGFTFNKDTGTLSVLNANVDNVTANAATIKNLDVIGNIIAVNFTANTGIFTGNGSGLSAIAGANVSGTVANATYAESAGSATTANAVAGANVSGTVANATYAASAGSATTAGTVTTAAQPNITSVGTLTSLGVSGNIIAVNLTATGNANFSGNTVSLGNVANLKISGGNTGQFLKTDGAGNLSFATPNAATGGNIYVFTRAHGTVYIEVQFGSITIVGRTGNISIPVQP